MGHRHRAALKQQNKAFKHLSSKPKSLKEKRRAAAAAAAAVFVNKTIAKAERVQQSRQKRRQQRTELRQQQTETAAGLAPKVVVLLPFSDSVCIDKVFAAVKEELMRDDAATGNVSGMDMDEDGSSPAPRPLHQGGAQHAHQRYLFTMPPYARNPAIPKRHKQQLLIVPAPSISAGEKLGEEESIQQEGTPPQRPNELLRYMDLCSSCDVLVCLFGGNCTYEQSAFSTHGYQVLQALKLQGLPPSVIGVGCAENAMLKSGHALNGKSSAAESLKFMRRFFESELGAERKFFTIGGATDWRPVLRALGAAATLTQAPKEINGHAKGAEAAACRRRGHLLAFNWRIACLPLTDDPQAASEACLEVVGLVRGAGLTCKLPVHVTGVGDFVVSRIDALGPLQAKRREPEASDGAVDKEVLGDDLTGVLEAAQPLQPLDMAAMEQTWPTKEEMLGADDVPAANPSRKVRVPKDVGDYERAWLESDTDNDSQRAHGEEDNMSSDAEMQDKELAMSDNVASNVGGPEATNEDWTPLNNAEQEQMKADNEAYVAERREAAAMEKEFPDQVGDTISIDTPLDIPAKKRFERYRGLKSFRSSPWAKNEDLPIGYGRIIDVSSIKGLARYAQRAHAELCSTTGGFSGRFCRLLLPLRHSYVLRQLVQQPSSLEGRDLDEALAAAMAQRLASRFAVGSGAPDSTGAALASKDDDQMLPDFLLVCQLLQHESQVAVVHSQVTFCGQEPIKGKDPVVMACGFRRFGAAPIYSEEPRQSVGSAAKWKFKRWAEPGSTLTATVFAPLVLPPAPCIMLKSDSSVPGGVGISGWGSVLPVNSASSRLIIKRVLLSGHPFKVHRRKAVVRFMFFNPDDVRWFAPVELHTKRGLRGNIVEPLGTHGYMKCKFSGYLKQNDEVLLPLYRRVFPKWYPTSWGGLPNQQPID